MVSRRQRRDAPAGPVRDDAVEEEDAPKDESPASALERRRVVKRRRLMLKAKVLDNADGPEEGGEGVSRSVAVRPKREGEGD